MNSDFLSMINFEGFYFNKVTRIFKSLDAQKYQDAKNFKDLLQSKRHLSPHFTEKTPKRN